MGGGRVGYVEFGVLQGCCPCSVPPPRLDDPWGLAGCTYGDKVLEYTGREYSEGPGLRNIIFSGRGAGQGPSHICWSPGRVQLYFGQVRDRKKKSLWIATTGVFCAADEFKGRGDGPRMAGRKSSV